MLVIQSATRSDDLYKNAHAKMRNTVGRSHTPSSRVSQKAAPLTPSPTGHIPEIRTCWEPLIARPIANATVNKTNDGYRADRSTRKSDAVKLAGENQSRRKIAVRLLSRS